VVKLADIEAKTTIYCSNFIFLIGDILVAEKQKPRSEKCAWSKQIQNL
jgi:hypothetical protein